LRRSTRSAHGYSFRENHVSIGISSCVITLRTVRGAGERVNLCFSSADGDVGEMGNWKKWEGAGQLQRIRRHRRFAS
jgi:hypothetical protein